MRYFLDTEFTDLPWTGRSQLLWVGLINETGDREFSAINTDCSLEHCSPFVQEHVLPHIGNAYLRLPASELAQALLGFVTSPVEFWAWFPSLNNLASLANDEDIELLYKQFADWDYQLICKLFPQRPTAWPARCHDLHRLANDTGIELPVNPRAHDPLSDAQWGREVWLRTQNQAQ